MTTSFLDPSPDTSDRRRWPILGVDDLVHALVRAMTAPTGAGAVVTGPAGVGKTALVDLAIRRLEAEGTTVVRLVATLSSSPISIDAVRHLTEVSSGSAPVLAVDDVPLLDAESSLALDALARSGAARLLLTARDGQPLPAPVTALLVEDRLQRIPVPLVDGSLLEQAASVVLGGPLTSDAASFLRRASAGIPLYARELLSAATVERRHDGWAFVGPPTVPPSLIDLVAARFARFTPEERQAFEAIAFAQPLPLEAADLLADADLLARLEHSGLLATVEVLGAPSIRLGHPLFEDVVRAQLGPLRQRRAALRAAEAIEILPSTPELQLRAAHLRVLHSLPMDADDALDAARQAMAITHPELAETLLSRAGDGFEAQLLRAATVSAQGRHQQAEDLLVATAGAAKDDAERARVLSRRGNNLRAAGRTAEAIEVLDAGLATVSDPYWRSFVAADLAYARLWSGDATPVAQVRPVDGTPLQVRANECLVGAVVAVMGGRLADAERLVAEGMPLVPAVEADMPAARTLLTLSQFLALAFGGLSDPGHQLVAAELDRTRAAALSSGTLEGTAAPGLWLATRSMLHLTNGDLGRTLTDVAAALPLLRRVDVAGLLPVVQAVESTALAGLGQVQSSRAAAAAVDPAWRWEPKVQMQLAVADAWRHVAGGDRDAAARILVDAAETAVENDHVIFGGLAAYDAIRLGRPRVAMPTLESITDRWEGALAEAFADHGHALVAGDPEALLTVARRLPAVGARIAGAEAAVQAAELFERRGLTTEAANAEFVANALAAPLLECSRLVVGNPRGLTDREREVAAHAAEGASSRQIADALGLSVRTVDNHLAAVYRKVGVTRRRDLAAGLTAFSRSSPDRPGR